MELPMELPYQASYFPKGWTFDSDAGKHAELSFQGKYAFVSITVPDPLTKQLKVVEGLNEQGLSFSLLAFANTQGPKDMVANTQKVLAAIDLGAWTLSRFKDVNVVKAESKRQPVMDTALFPLDLLKTPIHFTLHYTTGPAKAI